MPRAMSAAIDIYALAAAAMMTSLTGCQHTGDDDAAVRQRPRLRAILIAALDDADACRRRQTPMAARPRRWAL